MTFESQITLALQHHQAGRLADAEKIYRQVLAQQPNHPDALHYLGLIAHQTGKHDAAVELIQRAIAIDPKPAHYHNNLATVLMALGNSHLQVSQFDDAITDYRRATAIKPDFALAWYNLGNALRKKGEQEQAVVAYQKAITLQSPFPEAQNNLGNAFMELKQFEQAAITFRQLLVVKPDAPMAHYNLANALFEAGKLDESISAFRSAVQLSNDSNADIRSNLGNVLKEAGELDDAIACFRRALAIDPSHRSAQSNLLAVIHYHPNFDAQAILAEHQHWGQSPQIQSLKALIRPHDNDRNPTRRLRIGYVSPDFREHSVGRFLLPIFENHDRTQFEIICYSELGDPDTMTRRLQSHVSLWRSTTGMADADVAEMIRKDRIDILVDLALHTAHNRLMVFAHKPAPVQATYLGYCSTSGLDTMDYRITDPQLDPPGSNEQLYTERSVHLPDAYWCYAPDAAFPEVNSLPALRGGGITFGCLNNFCKVTAPTLATWARLLHAVPDSRLILHVPIGTPRQRLTQTFETHGIAPARINFHGRAPIQEYLRLYQKIDIALDPFPFNGGTATCDALWMGVPIVTLCGSRPVSRAGLTLLTQIGLTDLVGHTEEQYIQIASALADDLPRLAKLRSTLRQRMQSSPLMDAPRFVRNLEAAYHSMWQSWCGK